jgi:hypothetical protein
MEIFKHYIHDESTGIISVIDSRNFYHCKEHQLNQIKTTASNIILHAAPEYKQRNAALGLLSDEETQQIKDSIQAIRTISNQKEAEILAVVWDGQESTRAEACDIVQRIFWE